MRRVNFKTKISIAMILILVLVSTAGFFAYRQFSKIVNGISDAGKPSMNLIAIKDLMGDIHDSENSVKSFTLTQDTVYVGSYERSVKLVHEKLGLITPTNAQPPALMDSLKDLVDQKFEVLDEILMLQSTFRVKDALSEVSNTLAEVSEKYSTEKTEEVVEVEDEEEKKKRFNIFRRRKEKEEEAKQERVQKEAQQKLQERDVVGEVYSELQGIKQREELEEEQALSREFDLLSEDKLITAEITSIIKLLEEYELQKIDRATKEASVLAKRANQQIAILCAAIGLLLMFMGYTIINYIRNNNRYKKALRRARHEAENLVKIKERFIATVSHEIRTPMNIISGFTEQLSQEDLKDSQQEQLGMVRNASDHLLNLVNEVLDLTKLESDKMRLEFESFQLDQVIGEVIKLTRPLIKEKDLEVTHWITDDVPSVVIGDAFRLRQILLNVVGNSIKFTEEGIVEIEVTASVANGQARVSLTVTDTGIGMTEEQQKYVFEEFQQADVNTTRNYGGTGLGLAITKKLIQLHGGTIEVESEPGKGTIITIEIPYEIGEQSDLPVENLDHLSESFDLSNLKILIVDDEVFNRKLLHTILAKYGVNVSEATDGKQAVEAVKQNNYDLILMDIRMPELDGFEATKIIRQELTDEKSRVPIIALSAGGSENDKAEFTAAEMNNYIPKPFKEFNLVKTIIDTLGIAPLKSPIVRKVTEEADDKMNFSSLKSISNGDEVFYTEMLETFCVGTESGYAEMVKLIEERDAERVADLSHRICAPCKHLQADKLYEMFKEIEEITRREEGVTDWQNIEELSKAIGNELEIVLMEVKRELNLMKSPH